MFAPILRRHRVTIEQMAILEPAVVESTFAGCITVLREAMETAISMGVPKQAAWDFCLGHIRTELAIIFGFAGFPLSDGAMKAIEQNRPRIFQRQLEGCHYHTRRPAKRSRYLYGVTLGDRPEFGPKSERRG